MESAWLRVVSCALLLLGLTCRGAVLAGEEVMMDRRSLMKLLLLLLLLLLPLLLLLLPLLLSSSLCACARGDEREAWKK